MMTADYSYDTAIADRIDKLIGDKRVRSSKAYGQALDSDAGINCKTIDRLRYGETARLTLAQVRSLCDALGGISETWLISGEGPMYRKDMSDAVFHTDYADSMLERIHIIAAGLSYTSTGYQQRLMREVAFLAESLRAGDSTDTDTDVDYDIFK